MTPDEAARAFEARLVAGLAPKATNPVFERIGEFLRGLSNRVLELGGESGTEAQPHAYPGSYIEYVERTGHEAPGVHR